MRSVVESLRDVVWVHGLDGTVTYCSPSVGAVLGYAPAELEGTNEQDLIHSLDRAVRNAVLERLRATNEPQSAVELRLRHRDGSFGWFEITDVDLMQDPVVHSIVTTARDVTVRKASAEELIDLSLRDALTGLPNRLALMDRLELALARTDRSELTLAVLFCDLDGFKVINDTLGHATGDRVLQEVAGRLRHGRRRSDTVARTGGDEFVIVCEGMTQSLGAIEIAAQVRDAVEQPLSLDGAAASISISIGIVTVDGVAARGTDATTLLANADAAMYRAKLQGKARWHVFDDTLIDEGTHRSELDIELRPALARGEFVLHYQPIFDLEHETIVGVDACLRWDHPSRGLLLPGQFIAVAEQSGLIASIGAWALSEACTQLRRWQQEFGGPAWISVSLSARHVVEPGLAATVSDVLGDSHLDPNCLWVLLAESALMRSGHSASVELAQVAALGVHLGMEDFGTGSATPTNLQHLGIDFLKIGRAFVKNLNDATATDEGGNAIVGVLAELGRGLKFRTIADGIEQAHELALVRKLGCHYGQGDLLSRAMTNEEFTNLLVRQTIPSGPVAAGGMAHASMRFGRPRVQAERGCS